MSDTSESAWKPGTNGQYLLAQFGHRSQRRLTLSMMLEASDLPEVGWSQYDQKCWRTGKMSATNSRHIRAREVGTYTGLRTYWHPATQRVIAAKVAPMASVIDAEAEVPGWGLHLMKRPDREGTVSEEIQIDNLEVPDLPNALLTKSVISGPSGTSTMRNVRGNIDRVIFALGCSALDGGLDWQEVFRVVQIQVMKIERTLQTSV
jgi:hypothetical protein